MAGVGRQWYHRRMTESGESREPPARRRQIADAAREIAAEQGWQAVTVRAIGARIGCSAPAIYQYFRDKDALLAALAAEGDAMLDAMLESAGASTDGSARRLRAAARAMWAFAIENPELYGVMHGTGGVAPRSSAGAPPALRRIAAKLVAKRGPGDSPDDFADRLAAAIHGCLASALAQRFPGGRTRAQSLCERLVEDSIRGLGRG